MIKGSIIRVLIGTCSVAITLSSCWQGEVKEEGVSTSLPKATSPVGIKDTAPAVVSETSVVTTQSPASQGSSGDSAASAKPAKIVVTLEPGRKQRDTISMAMMRRAGLKDSRWPVKTAPPLPGSILPAKRIVAYYGNPLSKKMGILGELPPDQMLARLDQEVTKWNKADPAHPVQPALHLIAVVAQGAPGKDKMYRLRMTDSLIERVYSWAQKKNAILFVDIQVGHSTVQQEIPRLVSFLKRPNVHLAIDPEFSMKSGNVPGSKIGTMDASDVNYAIKFLRDLVVQNNLPPKVLVVHRFTRKMLTNASAIRLDPHVQVVIDMDGWGAPWLKLDSYRDYEQAEPVQFTGFKLFYHNDTKKGDPLMTPREVLELIPQPLYIQYQ